MNEDELKHALHGAVPEGPAPDGWAAAARGRAARARGGAIGAALTSLVVVGALVAVNQPPTGIVGVPASSPAGTAAPVMPAPALNPDCDGDLTPVTKAPRPADGAGIVRASLCPAVTGRSFAVPADSLTTLAPRLFATVVGLPWVAPGTPCEDDVDGARFRLVFTSDDGRRIVLDATTTSACPTPKDPDAITRWASLAKDIEGLWQQERAPRAPEPAAATCADWHRPSLLSVEPAQLTSGAACDYAIGAPAEPSTLKRWQPLNAGDLATLVADLHARSRPGTNIDSRSTGRQLSLQSAWGNPLVFWEVEGHQWFAFTDGTHHDQLFWEPGGEATATIERAFEAAEPLPPDVSGTQQPRPDAACGAAKVSTGDIPEAALTLQLCPAGDQSLRQFVPLDALGADGARTVLAALRTRPAADPGQLCDSEPGPDFRLVAGYSGREPVVMDLRLNGCREVGTATDRRMGADEVLDAFRGALAQQRGATSNPPYFGPPVRVERTGVLCSRHPQQSVIPFAPNTAMIGAVCRFADEAANTPKTQQTIWGELTLKIADDLAAHSTPWEPRPCPARPPSQGPLAIALLNGWGDVLSLAPDACVGSYTYVAGGKQYLWTPTEELAKQIEKAAG